MGGMMSGPMMRGQPSIRGGLRPPGQVYGGVMRQGAPQMYGGPAPGGPSGPNPTGGQTGPPPQYPYQQVGFFYLWMKF